MKHEITLVLLSNEQVGKAKEINGSRKQITHGLICGPHGQIFGTEKHCRKYFSVWVDIFPHLFSRGVETDNFQISNFESTFDLVNKLIALHDPLAKKAEAPKTPKAKGKTVKVGFLSKLFGKNS